ncbi:MAG: sigma-70 family RNA polymerase sigma factor [Clostridia bacterium]|nr:sigma-70 family RNA polymerase sigma factor [Clostridia bacterium]
MENKYLKLTDEELVLLVQSGDTYATETLFKRYMPQVKNIARSFFLFGGDATDLIQEGNFGLFKAAHSFTEGKSFKNFALVCIKRNIISAVKSANREKHKILNDYADLTSVYGEEGFEGYFGDDSLDPAVMFNERESKQELKARLEKILSPLENEILGYYLNGYTYLEISQNLQKSVKAVDNAIQRIRKKILKEFKN